MAAWLQALYEQMDRQIAMAARSCHAAVPHECSYHAAVPHECSCHAALLHKYSCHSAVSHEQHHTQQHNQRILDSKRLHSLPLVSGTVGAWGHSGCIASPFLTGQLRQQHYRRQLHKQQHIPKIRLLLSLFCLRPFLFPKLERR